MYGYGGGEFPNFEIGVFTSSNAVNWTASNTQISTNWPNIYSGYSEYYAGGKRT